MQQAQGKEAEEMWKVPEEPEGRGSRVSWGAGLVGRQRGTRQSGLGITCSMSAGQMESDWPLFPHALGASSHTGVDGEADISFCPWGCCVLQKGWSCGVSAQNSAAPCSRHCRGVSPD